MNILKPKSLKFYETGILFCIILFIIANGIFSKDSYIAVISSVCGILYTVLAGKGKPICYLFGVSGSGFYCLLSFMNAFWGNLALYLFYYLPMQIFGFFQWNKNLKSGENNIIKTKLSKKDFITLTLTACISSLALIILLYYMHDTNPVMDGVTTVFSIAGMYLTVKRCIEQWFFWMIVNGLSLIMWLETALSGVKVYSTVIMWAVYFILAVYFYIEWRKELKINRIGTKQ